jgi:hypothetical protein
MESFQRKTILGRKTPKKIGSYPISSSLSCTAGLACVTVAGLWGATNWTPTLVRALPALHGLDAVRLTSYISYATMANRPRDCHVLRYDSKGLTAKHPACGPLILSSEIHRRRGPAAPHHPGHGLSALGALA